MLAINQSAESATSSSSSSSINKSITQFATNNLPSSFTVTRFTLSIPRSINNLLDNSQAPAFSNKRSIDGVPSCDELQFTNREPPAKRSQLTMQQTHATSNDSSQLPLTAISVNETRPILFQISDKDFLSDDNRLNLHQYLQARIKGWYSHVQRDTNQNLLIFPKDKSCINKILGHRNLFPEAIKKVDLNTTDSGHYIVIQNMN